MLCEPQPIGTFYPMPKTSDATARGRRPNANSKSGQIRALLGTGMSVADIAKKVGCTTALVYNVKSASGKSGKRSPSRPQQAPSAGRDDLVGILAAVQRSERERTQMRAALEKIQAVLAEALA